MSMGTGVLCPASSLIGLLMASPNYSLLGPAAQSISRYLLALSVLAVVMMSNSLSSIDIGSSNPLRHLGLEYLATAHRFHHLLDCHLAECERLPLTCT